jgi:DNA-binding NarL/FixJ family response regulator
VLEATVVLALGEQAEGEEVLHFLDRLPAVRVVGAASDRRGLEREVQRTSPDAVVASPDLLSANLDVTSLLAVAGRETTAGLRAAIESGARGFFLWPEERDSLARAVERTARHDDGGEGTTRGEGGPAPAREGDLGVRTSRRGWGHVPGHQSRRSVRGS